MADLVKTVLGGAWGLVIGWILPLFLSLQVIAYLLGADIPGESPGSSFSDRPLASQQVILLAVAAVGGLVLAAAQAPLYRILEGYLLWPRKLAQTRIAHHRLRRQKLAAEFQAAQEAGEDLRAGLTFEALARYPVRDEQFAPTALGNAIRRFETYSGDRYMLDSQLLWHHLTTSAPERVMKAVDNARTNVDFFVCLLYGGVLTATLGLLAAIGNGLAPRHALAVVSGGLVAVGCSRMAVLACDEWDAAVRAMVDMGRAGTAATFGLVIPTEFPQERMMWQVVNTLVRRPYEYSVSRQVPEKLSALRVSSKGDDVAIYDEIVARYGADPAPALRELVANALSGKCQRLLQLGKSREAAMVAEELAALYASAPEPALQALVAKAQEIVAAQS